MARAASPLPTAIRRFINGWTAARGGLQIMYGRQLLTEPTRCRQRTILTWLGCSNEAPPCADRSGKFLRLQNNCRLIFRKQLRQQIAERAAPGDPAMPAAGDEV